MIYGISVAPCCTLMRLHVELNGGWIEPRPSQGISLALAGLHRRYPGAAFWSCIVLWLIAAYCGLLRL